MFPVRKYVHMSAAFELFDTCLMLVNKPLRQRSWPPPMIRVQPFPVFDIMMNSLTENIRKEAPTHMMFTDDVALCARRKTCCGWTFEQWRRALEKRGMKVSRAKTEYMCLNETPLGSVKMQSDQLPQITEFN